MSPCVYLLSWRIWGFWAPLDGVRDCSMNEKGSLLCWCVRGLGSSPTNSFRLSSVEQPFLLSNLFSSQIWQKLLMQDEKVAQSAVQWLLISN